MNIPTTEDEALVFEDWCEEQHLHPLEVTCVDPAGLWVLSVYGWGDGWGFGWGDGYGGGYGDVLENGYGYGGGYRWATR